MGKLACTDAWIPDGLSRMSMQADRPECECGEQITGARSAE